MRREFVFLLLAALPLAAQSPNDSQPSLAQILQRIDVVEQENQQLLKEVHALKQEVEALRAQPATSVGPSPHGPTLQERVTVNEHRIAEQAQTKVEASQKFPILLNGMLLFNAFANTGAAGYEYAPETGLLSGLSTAGATVRQTLLGLQFQGPRLPGGGRVNGSLMMDFWGGPSVPSAGWLRIRRAGVSLEWKNRTVFVGQDKPLISPFSPDSLAEVGIPPLAGAGNLWVWLPQARYEERVPLGGANGITGQVVVLQTGENYESVPAEYKDSLEVARPAVETRIAFWHKFDDIRRVELGSGFHESSTHVAGASVPSRIGSVDWQIIPSSKFSFTGTLYTGENVASLGALGNGFTVLPNETVRPVHSSGGWAQLSFPITERLTLNLFGGIEADRGAYLAVYSTVHDFTYASNIMYRLGPNVVVSLEALQMRTRSFSGAAQVGNHYDVAVGYLF